MAEIAPMQIDKLHFTIGAEFRLPTIGSSSRVPYGEVLEVREDLHGTMLPLPDSASNLFARYRLCFLLDLGEGSVIIATGNRHANTNQRPTLIQMNPNRFRSTTLQSLRDFFAARLGSGNHGIEHLRSARVTRIDYCKDIYDTNLDFVRGHVTHIRNTEIRYEYVQGTQVSETFYFGGVESDRRVCIYDKAREIAARNPDIDPLDIRQRVRVEVVLKNQGDVRDLVFIPHAIQPFRNISLFDFETPFRTPENDANVMRYQIDSCILRGVSAHLLGITSDTERARIKNRLIDRYAAPWWPPEEELDGESASLTRGLKQFFYLNRTRRASYNIAA